VSDLTSEATTAKPRPASPARAASMVALSAKRLVWLAISLIRLVTAPTLPAASDSLPIVAWALLEVDTASMVNVRDDFWPEAGFSRVIAFMCARFLGT